MKLLSFLNDDIFISYARADATAYAMGLADMLTRSGFSCFIDRLGTDANKDLPETLLQKIRDAKMFIVICTAAANESDAIKKELKEFIDIKKSSRMVIPIVFDKTALEQEWYHKIGGKAAEFEPEGNLLTGNPLLSTFNRIEKAFTYARSKRRLNQYAIGALIALTILIIASVAASIYAAKQLNMAKTAREEVVRETELTRQAKAAAREARKAKIEADLNLNIAKKQEQKALENAEKYNVLAKKNSSKAFAISAKTAFENKDPVGAEFNLIKSLSFDDQLSTRENILALKSIGVRNIWQTPNIPRGSATAISNDGKKIAFGGDDHTIRIWDTHNGNEIFILKGHTRRLTCVAFDHTGDFLCSGGDDNSIRLWNLRNGKEVKSFIGHTNTVLSVSFDLNNKLISISKDLTLRQWEIKTGKQLFIHKLDYGPVAIAAIAPNNKVIAYAGRDSIVYLLDVDKLKVTKVRGHHGLIKSLAFDKSSFSFASGADDASIKIWNIRNIHLPTLNRNLKTEINESIAFLPYGKKFIAVSPYEKEDNILIWDLNKGDLVKKLTSNSEVTSGITTSTDGRWFATGGDKLTLWMVPGYNEADYFKGHGEGVQSIAFNPDGSLLASSGWDRTVRVWNFKKMTQLNVYKTKDAATSVAFSPDGALLAFGEWGGTVTIWDLALKKKVFQVNGNKNFGYITGIAFSPDGNYFTTMNSNWGVLSYKVPEHGKVAHQKSYFTNSGRTIVYSADSKYFAAASNDTLRLWNTELRKWTILYKCDTTINSLVFSPNNAQIAISFKDRPIKIFDIQKRASVLTIHDMMDGATCLAYSPDGKRIAATGYGWAGVWDTESGVKLTNLIQQTDDKNWIEAISFSPEGDKIAVGLGDGHIRFLSYENTPVVKTLRGHSDYVTAIRFDPKTDNLLTGSDDDGLRLWNKMQGYKGASLNKKDSAIFSDWSPDGKIISFQLNDQIVIRDFSRFHTICILKGLGKVFTTLFSPDNKLIAASEDKNENYVEHPGIRVWEWAKQKTVFILKGHVRTPICLAFSPNGKMLASGGYDHIIKLWDMHTGKEIATLLGHVGTVTCVAFSGDGKYLASSSRDGTVKVWNIASRNEIYSFLNRSAGDLFLPDRTKNNWIESVAFTKSNDIVSLGFDNIIRFWDMHTGRQKLEIPILSQSQPKPNGSWLKTIKFNYKGNMFATSGGDYNVRLWDLTKINSILKQSPQDLLKSLYVP